jgi:beta-glucosidase/6-phospho-beta-glucosidase/beta-galactosidase
MAYVSNWLFSDAVSAGTADWNVDGVVDDQTNPALQGRLDFLGINYFTRTRLLSILPPLTHTEGLRGLLDEVIPGFKPTNTSQMGWTIYPQGLFDAVTEAWDRYGLPVVNTENGFAERQPDTKRPAYIRDHVEELERARAAGVDVRGYFYWSLMDNFEWDQGFRPRFGLLSTEPGMPGVFRRTHGADELRSIIQGNGVSGTLGGRLSPVRR